jgi:hypothetical protein
MGELRHRGRISAVAGDPLTSGVDLIRSYGAVAVVGAGLSMSSYPMTAQLPVMLARAFDLSLDDRRELADRLRRADGPAKGLLVDDAAMRIGWEIAHRAGETRTAFQQSVARHDLDREPAPAHKALARLIHAGAIRYIISFNWDTAIERAYEQYFGRPVPNGVLAKPHGDAAKPDETWILPFQDEIILESVIERMAELKAGGPRLLLIVGYSGSDPAVLRELIDPVEEIWPTRRVSPSATGDEGISALADTALPYIADALGAVADVPGWLWVTYERKRDLGAALLGYKLGPQDVDACPQTSAVDIAAMHLARAGFAVISGDAGGGKSLAAFQAGRLLNRDGWGVLELVSQGVASVDDVRTFAELTGPVLAVVDDAQALDPVVRIAFERSVDADHAVLMVTTERSDDPGHSTIRPDQAVATIRQFCLDHHAEVSRVVSAFDDRVGKRLTNEPFEHRVEASTFAKLPWEFMFTLGGGERRVSESIDGLTDTDDGPLLLGLIAVTEILSLDVGVGVDRLAELAAEAGRDRGWVEQVLRVLVDRRLASLRDGRVRTPHIRLAQRALQVLCWDTGGQHWDRLADLIARRFTDTTESFEGRQWLSSMLSNSDSNRRHRNRLFPDDVARAVVEEASTAVAGHDRHIAGNMIWEVGWWWAMSDELADKVEQILVAWLPEMTSDDVHGIYQAYNALSRYNSHAGRVSASIAPEQIAAIVSDHVDVTRGHDWGWLLGGLAAAHGIDSRQWRARFAAALDVDLLVERVAAGVANKIPGAVDFVHSLTQLAPLASAECIRSIAPEVVRLIESDLPGASHALFDWCVGEFLFAAAILNEGHEDDGGADEGADDEQGWLAIAQAIGDLVNSVDWTSAGRSVATTNADLDDLGQFDLFGYSISSLAPDRWSEAMAAVDLDHLDKVSQGEWTPSSRIARLVYTLASGSDPSPGRRWARRHTDELEHVPAFLAAADPELAAEAMHRGHPIVLADSNQWEITAKAVGAIAGLDSDLAAAVMRENEDQILGALGSDATHLWDGIEHLVRVVDAVDPDWINDRLDVMNLETLRECWAKRVDAGGSGMRTARFLLDRTAKLA